MRIFDIKKHSGGYRRIFAPDTVEKQELRNVLSQINQERPELKAAHGFREYRSVVTNALPHVGAKVTISLDLKDFFDTVTLETAKARLSSDIYSHENCFLNIEGKPEGSDKERAARQGLPTSPAIANVCAAPLDAAIIKSLKKLGFQKIATEKPEENPDAAYTRYADDLSISLWSDPGQPVIRNIISKTMDCAIRCGFRVNYKKIRVQRSKGGRREICGILVDDNGIYPRRDLRRRLRAAIHNVQLAGNSRGEQEQARKCKGLFEFAQLRKPKTAAEKAEEIAKSKESVINRAWDDAEKMAKADNLRINRKWGKDKVITPKILGNNCKISIDPVDFLNMGQVHYEGQAKMSCVSRGGCYHYGIPFWMAHPGVALGLMDGTGFIEHAGVKRPKIKARVILFQLKDGTKCYSRFYGDTSECVDTLKRELQAVGYRYAGDIKGQVVGYVDKDLKIAYFDFGSTVTARMKDGITRRKIVF